MAAGAELVLMEPGAFAAFRASAIASYARDVAQAGTLSAEEGTARATAEFDRLLPQGFATPDHTVFAIAAQPGGERVGHLWFATVARDGRKIGYVYDLWVDVPFRRRGHAAAALRAIEAHARKLDLASVQLHTFGHNTGAQALYRKLGFTPASIVMQKRLDGAANVPREPE